MFEGKSSDSSPLWHLENLKQIEYCSETTANTAKATVATSMRTGTRKTLNQFGLFRTAFGSEEDIPAYLLSGVPWGCLAFLIVVLGTKKSNNLG